VGRSGGGDSFASGSKMSATMIAIASESSAQVAAFSVRL